MTKTRRLLTALSVTGLTMAPLGTADAFFGFWPGSWFGGGGGFSFGFGVGGGWRHHGWGHPWYGYGPGWGHPYRWRRYHPYRWGYPWYGGHYPGLYSPWLSPVVSPVVPVVPATTPTEK